MTFKNDRVASGYGASQKFDVSAKNGPIKAFLLAAGIIRVIFLTIRVFIHPYLRYLKLNG